MIINAAHDFGFVHIPKCAGSTIRQQLREEDDLDGKFYHTMTLPDIGRINGNHVPLDLLESHFSEDLARLRAVTSYAIVRDPTKRFVSTVAQYLRSHVREPAELSVQEILTETNRIITAVGKDTTRSVISNTIFYRQVDYVYLREEKIIEHIYAMENIQGLQEHITAHHGLTLQANKVWNPTVTYRVSGISGALKRANGLARRMLPKRAHVALRDLGIKAMTTKGVPALETALLESTEVRSFIAEHYATDQALFDEIRNADTSDHTS